VLHQLNVKDSQPRGPEKHYIVARQKQPVNSNPLKVGWYEIESW